MQKAKGPFDVIVIGDGITGLSTVFHLRQLGLKSVALSTSGVASQSTSLISAGFVTGGQLDNFTRVSHRHGMKTASEVWQLGRTAYLALIEYCRQGNLPAKTASRVRLITSEQELIEAKLAVEQLTKAGFPTSLFISGTHSHPLFEACSNRVLAVQVENMSGGKLDAPSLLHKLRQDIGKTPLLPAIERLATHSGKNRLTSRDGQTFDCEIVVLASHLGIKPLLPELRDAMVPVADQWTEFRLIDSLPPAWRNVTFTANHANEWGVAGDTNLLRLGGGRYLRPLAGNEALKAETLAKITDHLSQQLNQTLSFGRNAIPLTSHSALDIRPCDELPIIGPMFGNGRILLGTGYMGAGLTLGFFAGRCLADLITLGHCQALPRSVWPERLRTLEA
jgi:glycine/D-amino acid oxidase-like deaminating enzyme